MKRTRKIFAICSALFLVACAFCACRKESGKVKVSFDPSNGSETEVVEILRGQKVSEPEQPEKSGYDFSGWYQGEKKWNFSSEVKEDLFLVAKWQKKQGYCLVVFDADGGGEVQNQTVRIGEKIQKPTDPKRNDTKTESYTFLGWWFEGQQWDFENVVEKEEMTLVAHYFVDRSTIQF